MGFGPRDGDYVADAAQTCRIVLVDDMPDIRFLLRVALEGIEEFEVVGEAGDGAQAVEVVAEHQPDVVILDIAMPVMDGLAAIPEIKRTAPDTKIVILTGFESESTYREAMERGAHSYLQKTVALSDITQTVWDVCRTPQPQA